MTKALLGGFPLLASKDVEWTLKEGVRPHTATYEMIPEHAEVLGKSPGPYTLETEKLTVKFLYCLKVSAGDNPNVKRVLMVDRRYWWTYKQVRRYYNMRRNVGVIRIQDPISPPEILKVDPDVWYIPWTLKNPAQKNSPDAARWQGQDVVLDILTAVSEPEINKFNVKAPKLTGVSVESLKNLPIENVPIMMRGDQAMEAALTYLPECGLYVNYDGNIVLYSKVSGAEKFMLEEAGPKLVGHGDAIFVDNALTRPSEIHVLFQYEPELRVDADESPSFTLTDDTRFMENVMPLPDFSNTVGGKAVAQGTYITISEGLTAFGAPPGFDRALTRDDIQKAMVPYMDLWSAIELNGVFDPNADWAARVAAIQEHFRVTYRINPRITDRILSYKAARIATVNVARGTRAPAVCYSDYCVLAGMRAFFNERKQGVGSKDASYTINVKGHPALPNELANKALTSKSKVAPAEVRIADPDQGIIHLEYKVDPVRLFEAVLPSMITQANQESNIDADGKPLIPGPTGDVTQRGRPISYDAVGRTHLQSLPKLTNAHKVSVILEAIPGAPNNEAAFYRVKVKPKDVEAMLPPAAKAGLSSAKGPVMEVYVGPGIETARVAWIDSRASDIDKIIGIGGNGKDVSEQVRDLVLNDSKSGVQGASLQAIAKAVAARNYASMTDRIEGEMAADLNAKLAPAGWLSEVQHMVTTKGAAITKLTFPEQILQFDIAAFLDASTRQIIYKLASPERVA